MVNRNKILSDISKFAVDAMSAFSGLREEVETSSTLLLACYQTRYLSLEVSVLGHRLLLVR